MGSSFDANDANDANSASAGGGGNATGVSGDWFFPDRVDLPFVTVLDSGPIAANTPVAQLRIQLGQFPQRDWAAEWYAWLVIDDLTATDDWQKVSILPPFVPNPAPNPLLWNSAAIWPAVSDEIDSLVQAAQDERADALGEILAQSDEFASYFLNMMTARPTSYPATTKILGIANLIGTFVAMYYKAKYQRPRPSQVCPALLPPIVVPGHASLPSGHSTQAHLMALCMTDVLAGTPQLAVLTDDLWTLADRIARNREIAGLHYPSDSAAGVLLAQGIHPLMNPALASGDPLNWYQQALKNATTEWT